MQKNKGTVTGRLMHGSPEFVNLRLTTSAQKLKSIAHIDFSEIELRALAHLNSDLVRKDIDKGIK